ncbi:MAG: hypothetical protein C4K60_17775 [Ideonella sp. MAG2]|nr:MAG: hypothetical protein C4K60_17775 [Ideonella sp. MAG2]
MMFRNLFQRDFRKFNLNPIFSLIIGFCIFYGYFDTYFDDGSSMVALIEKALSQPQTFDHIFWSTSPYFYYLMKGVIAFFLVYTSCFAYFLYRSTISSFDNEGKAKFQAIMLSHSLTNLLDLAMAAALVYAVGAISYLINGSFTTLDDLYGKLDASIMDWLKSVPTLVELPYPLSFLFAILLVDFVTYAKHWVCHYSRFLWYTVHRVHHSAEVLHSLGIGPAFAFDIIFFRVPAIFLTLALTKLFHAEPLFLETLAFHACGLLVGKFSHASAFYKFAYHNVVVRRISDFYGAGVYHYTHHSAIEGEEAVNLAGTLYMFWDRLFGTYVKPREEKPPVGLTHQPDIVLNPFVLYFSGIHKIIYELKSNPPKYWLKIIFGSVHFTPPMTRDVLILGYTKKLAR